MYGICLSNESGFLRALDYAAEIVSDFITSDVGGF